MELEVADVSLREALRERRDDGRGAGGARRDRARPGGGARASEVAADERKVKQVLFNLLSNAVKFTPRRRPGRVRARREDGDVEVAVRDTGVGIAPEDQELIFEEFRQVSEWRGRSRGHGPGLALAKRLMELHGGRHHRWRASLAKGSTFTFTLPVERRA